MLLLSFLVSGLTLAQESSPTIPFEKYELDNGLDVILSEDHSIPFVQVNIWYDVGSKDEVAGRTGFAHLFEHLMFQGSAHHDAEYFQPLQSIGGQVNGTTNTDRTNYYEGVPAEQLPLALWLESDRMGWLLDALTEEKLANQKDVVRNERRQSYENRPYGEVHMWLSEAVYPEGHPYHVTTIGRHEDIEAATLTDVSAFFEKWYVPNNASLSICGDFDPQTAKALVEHYFGPIPRGEEVHSITQAQAELTEETVITKHDEVPHAKVWIVWITPALYEDGDAEMDIISSVLSSGKDSRLYQHLVHDLQIANSVDASQYSSRLHSTYVIEATAAEGVSTQDLVLEIDNILAQLRQEGPTQEEIDVAKLNWEVAFYERLQPISAKANMLNSYNTLTGDPGYITQDLRRYRDVTLDSVNSALNTQLPVDKRVVLHVLPQTDED